MVQYVLLLDDAVDYMAGRTTDCERSLKDERNKKQTEIKWNKQRMALARNTKSESQDSSARRIETIFLWLLNNIILKELNNHLKVYKYV